MSSAFIGTTFMTANSYLMSAIFNEDFREPAHLTTMISRLAPGLSTQAKGIAGWGAHYAMGLVFASVYVELWETGRIKHSVGNGIVLGIVSGLLGSVIWKGTFKAHPVPPLIRYSHYYLQRIPAHIVFAVFATLAYRLILRVEKGVLPEEKDTDENELAI